MNKVITVIMLAGLLASCNTNQKKVSEQKESNSSTTKQKTMSKKETVGTFLGAVMQQNPEKMRELANTNYIQHNPFIPTGLEPFIQMLPILKENGTTAENIRMFQDGNYVFMHNIWKNAKPFGADEMVSFDIIRLDENGKVAEHWDVMMPQMPANESGRTLTDGAKEIADLDKTEANKTQVKVLFDVLINGTQEEAGAAVMANFDPNYKQHNPKSADGIAGFMAAMPTEQWLFTKQHKVLGEGNFVLSISEGTHKGVHSVFYDLVRLENAKIVEHWDVIQAIPTENLANDNGMFNF